ncbi:MAG: hypothetical protein HY342_05035 [Candidatus Lambdaproteobacteria bacterium]|nr:hypothetical protein [Candidatus Lambdaproteobacteria bacterium]
MENQASQHTPEAHALSAQLPEDFAKRLATKIVVTNERERDPEKAVQDVARLIMRNVSQPGRERLFADTAEILLEGEETRRYAAIGWVSVTLDHQGEPRYEQFVGRVVDALIFDHTNIVRPPVELDRRRRFSFYAGYLGRVFIAMMDINSELYEVVNLIYSRIIRREMELENQRSEEATSSARRIIMTQQQKGPTAAKKLYDEIVDYIHARGEFKSESLNQQNPNEFMAILADRMRATRRYVIQDIMNRQALSRKKEAEKELSERLAAAEDIILARDTFKKALNLFWTEKRYNFKFLAVEKVRVTLQVSAILVGIVHFLVGYLGLYGMLWWEGLAVALIMYVFARIFCSRHAFQRFFPSDVSKELEVVVGSVTPTLRKMSKGQMDAFLIRQVKDPANLNLLFIMPEFMKYVFAVMPERHNTIVTTDELSDLMETMELDIARTLRAAAPPPPPI